MDQGLKQSKIDKFLKDQVMSDAVFEVIQDAFLKRKGVTDVQYLAAERLALSLLEDAWRELDKYKLEESNLSPPLRQVGM